MQYPPDSPIGEIETEEYLPEVRVLRGGRVSLVGLSSEPLLLERALQIPPARRDDLPEKDSAEGWLMKEVTTSVNAAEPSPFGASTLEKTMPSPIRRENTMTDIAAILFTCAKILNLFREIQKTEEEIPF